MESSSSSTSVLWEAPRLSPSLASAAPTSTSTSAAPAIPSLSVSVEDSEESLGYELVSSDIPKKKAETDAVVSSFVTSTFKQVKVNTAHARDLVTPKTWTESAVGVYGAYVGSAASYHLLPHVASLTARISAERLLGFLGTGIIRTGVQAVLSPVIQHHAWGTALAAMPYVSAGAGVVGGAGALLGMHVLVWSGKAIYAYATKKEAEEALEVLKQAEDVQAIEARPVQSPQIEALDLAYTSSSPKKTKGKRLESLDLALPRNFAGTLAIEPAPSDLVEHKKSSKK